MSDTNEENALRALQLKSLEILLYFQKICEENGLLFYFCGGCCIGALRHGRFVPWDDDIDVFMPRDDYERLAQIWAAKADTARYAYCRTDKDTYTRLLSASISDNNTTFIKSRQKDLDINHGIRLELFPLDGCPSSRFKRKAQILWALIFSMFNTGEAPISKGKAFETIGKILLFLTPTYRLRYRIWRYAEKRMSRFKIADCDKITELCARYRYMVNEYPKEAFASAVYKEFEGHMLPLPAGYDTYLTMAFGDYMTPPPAGQQTIQHDAVFVDTENSYLKYKGIYYPVKD